VLVLSGDSLPGSRLGDLYGARWLLVTMGSRCVCGSRRGEA